MDQIHDPPSVTIRYPATANLMLDSADRNATVYPLANSFQISKPQALMNGFFHRIGTTEMVLEWNTPNISKANGNNTLTVDLSGNVSGTITQSVTFDDGFYTSADLISALAILLDTYAAAAPLSPLPVIAASAGTTGVNALITFTNPAYVKFTAGPLQAALGLPTTFKVYNTGAPLIISAPDLRGIRYLDFISAQLTYNQDLKDSSTAQAVRDVLSRWYMTWDNPPPLDAFGLPIYMGMSPFVARRIFSPPKQIRWDNIQPIGNLAFEVYDDGGELAPFVAGTNWLMTLQVSEN